MISLFFFYFYLYMYIEFDFYCYSKDVEVQWITLRIVNHKVRGLKPCRGSIIGHWKGVTLRLPHFTQVRHALGN